MFYYWTLEREKRGSLFVADDDVDFLKRAQSLAPLQIRIYLVQLFVADDHAGFGHKVK